MFELRKIKYRDIIRTFVKYAEHGIIRIKTMSYKRDENIFSLQLLYNISTKYNAAHSILADNYLDKVYAFFFY